MSRNDLKVLDMGPLTTDHSKQRWSTAEYASELTRSGTKTVAGSRGTFWVRHETAAMLRLPTFDLGMPSISEVRQVLWRGPAAVIGYIVEPDETHRPNACLYACDDQTYSLDKLSKPARRDTRRAQRSLRICRTQWSAVLKNGFTAFAETRARIGLSSWTFTDFLRYYKRFSSNPCHQVIAAWREGVLVAFMPLIVVDDWVEIGGSFATDRYRTLCPNNGLAHHVLSYFLEQHSFRMVSYGLSSIQENGGVGLHNYKRKVGFEARPVHRTFLLHPLLRPFANRFTLSIVRRMVRFRPGNRHLEKASGMLSSMLN